MYIIVNSDLDMTKGKTASQVGHVVEKLTERLIVHVYESLKIDDLQRSYMKWKRAGRRKVVLKAPESTIRSYLGRIDAEYIVDEGVTQIAENSLTVVGFLPSPTNEHKELFKELKLL